MYISDHLIGYEGITREQCEELNLWERRGKEPPRRIKRAVERAIARLRAIKEQLPVNDRKRVPYTFPICHLETRYSWLLAEDYQEAQTPPN